MSPIQWLQSVGADWWLALKWVAGLAVVFGVLVRLTPCNPGMYWWKDRRAFVTDLVYWFVVPLFLTLARWALLLAGVAFLCGGRDPDFLPVRGWPVWQQCLAILLIQDVMLYWIHRIFHTRLGWDFHAVHHSPKVLDWLSTVRFHPVNNLLAFVLTDVAVLLMGFSPAVFLVLVPFNTVYSALVHANLDWTFGPLRYAFASPVFHRWHHTTLGEGLDKNFASTFPFLDLIFGTFYMPAGKLPEQFGNGEPDFPEDFLGQLLHPFRRRTSPAAAPALEAAGRRRAALRRVVSLAVIVPLLGFGLYQATRLLNPTEPAGGEAGLAKLQEVQAQAARQRVLLDLALQAWLNNDLVQASAILDQVPPPFQLAPEHTHLRNLCRRKGLPLVGHKGAVLGVAISADGGLIASGGEDGTVRVWDAEGRAQLTLPGHERPVRSVAISADRRVIVSGGYDGAVRVWDAATGQEKFALRGHRGFVLGVAVSADGRRVASAGADGTVRVWDGETGQEQHALAGHTSAVPSVALSGDGERVVSAGWASAKLWNADTGRARLTLAGHTDLVYSLAISPDGRRVVTGSFDQAVKVWDATTGQDTLTLRGHTGPIYGVALSADARVVVSGGKDLSVKAWDVERGRELFTLRGHTADVTSVAVSADGRHVVSGSRDGALRLWDARECSREEQARSERPAGPVAAR
jgi:sterol desaturase/sphingolipid hydroxylase (fatty acid hydroxylase superfamily)